MAILEIKSATITEKGQISIPKEIRELKGLNIGDKIAIIAFEDRIEIRPLGEISKDIEKTKKRK